MSVLPPRRDRAPVLARDSAEPARHGAVAAAWRWLTGFLGRSLRLERRRNQLHVVLVDRPAGPGAAQPKSPLLQMLDELGARLLVHDPATQAVRNLYVVHKELAAGGWAAVSALPRPVTGRALAEAEMLQSEEPSPLLATLIEQLQAFVAAADARADQETMARADAEWEAPEVPEVSEASHEEYELMERSWIGTVPSGLEEGRPSAA